MGLFLSVGALVLGAVLGYSGQVMAMIAVSCVGLILSLVTEVVIAGLAGMERIARTAMWSTVQTYVVSGGCLIVVLTSQSLVAYVAVGSLSWLVPLIANWWQLRPHLTELRQRHPGAWTSLIRGGVPVFMMTALSLVYQTIDVPILEGISGADVVGWYTLALRWIGMPIFITTIVVTAFLPQLSALAHREVEAFATLTNRAIRFVLVVNIPAALGLFMVSSDLIELLYGPEFEESVVLMRLLAVWVPLVAVNTVLATSLIAADRHKRYIWIAATAAILNPLLAIRAIHLTDGRYDNGAIGAAVVTVLTEVFIVTCTMFMRPPGVMDRSTVWYITRCVVGASTMIVPIVLLDDRGIVLKVLAGAVTYGVSSLAVRTLSTDELSHVLDRFRARGASPDADANAATDLETTDRGGDR